MTEQAIATPSSGEAAGGRRILVLAPQPFFTQRGTPIAVRLMLETLAARGDRIDVIVYPDGEDIEIEGCRISRVPALPGLTGIGPGFSLRKLAADIVMAPMALARLITRRYDFVIAVEEAAYIAMIFSKLTGVPYIADVDSSIPEQIDDKYGLSPRMRGALTWVETRATRNAIGALTCCKALNDLVRAQAPDLPVQTVEDITMLEPEDGRDPPEDARFEAPTIMYVGNLEPYQGVDLLMEGLAGLAPGIAADLVVIGGRAEHIEAAKARAGELGIADRTHFLGPRPVEHLGRYLRAADIVASPRTQGRNTPMKVYSYLDSGRPLIATRLYTHTQVLDDTIAMLVEPTPEGMADGLTRLLEDPGLRTRMAEAAQTRVQAEFSRAGYERKLNGFLDEQIIPRLRRRKRARSA
ncbi:MAG: glycosyltransferase family 4 protein [Pseudomonadota bacterium]